MNLRFLLSFLVVFSFSQRSFAQFKTGFKTGLNFATIKGPSEKDAAGNGLESWKNTTGFHIGMTIAKPITDAFGVRAEVLYSKKGGLYTFDAPVAGTSFRYFETGTDNIFTTSEKSKVLISTNNTYIDIPLTVYGRLKDFEIQVGASVGFLVGSIGEGSMNYQGKTNPPQNVSTGDLNYNLKYNYRKDLPGGFDEKAEKIPVKINAQNQDFPQTLGAYYEQTADNGNLYNTVDVAGIFGISYYMSRSLYANVRLQYGFSDITNNKADQSRTQLDANKAPIFNADKDQNFVISASVGFSF
jgi:Outer membrane protein beta-barrel domain